MNDIDEILKAIKSKSTAHDETLESSLESADEIEEIVENFVDDTPENISGVDGEEELAAENEDGDVSLEILSHFSTEPIEDAGEFITNNRATDNSFAGYAEQPEDITVIEKKLREASTPKKNSRGKKQIKHSKIGTVIRLIKVNSKSKPKSQRNYVVGMFTIAASLITIGFAMLFSLFSPAGILNAIKITPLILVYFGLEVAINIIAHRSVRIRFNGYALLICGSLIVLTFLMSLLTLIVGNTYNDRYFLQEKFSKEIEADFFQRLSDFDNIANVDVEVVLYDDDLQKYWNQTYIKESDSVNVTFHFTKSPNSVFAFAEECQQIVAVINESGYLFENIKFIADDSINRMQLSLNGYYQLNLSAAEMTSMVGYVGLDVIADVPDLEDE